MDAERPGRVAWGLGVLLLTLVSSGCGDDVTSGTRGRYDANGEALFAVERGSDLPSLVLIVIDTLRHDALPLGEDERTDARMPHLASVAARGVSFGNAAAAAPWTLPSITSMLTGLPPSSHGLSSRDEQLRLVPAITTWAEILRTTYGYETVAHTAGPWFSGSGESVLQGFEYARDDFSLQDCAAKLRQWARVRDPGRPFFLLLHTFDAHEPCGALNHPWRGTRLPDVCSDPALFGPAAEPAEIFRRCYLDAGTGIALSEALGRRPLADILHRYAHAGYAAAPRPALAAEIEGAYWAGVRWTDELLARTTAFLGRQGLLENALLVVTGDHGEGFGEHGSLSHGRLLYDELIRVPLVMIGPEPFAGGRVITSSVGLVDVLPTFFDWAGLVAQDAVGGRSVLSLLEDEDEGCRPVVSEERLDYLNTGETQDAIRLSVRTAQWKYVVTYDLLSGIVREEAYDLLIDPDEVDDLAEGSGRLPANLVFDHCLCEAVEAVRHRIWSRRGQQREPASHIAYGTSSRGPATPLPAPCSARVE